MNSTSYGYIRCMMWWL